jgi:MYXO-CTERM domain-containing protein
MHAGAFVAGAVPQNTQVFHVPGQAAALSTFFPTTLTNAAAAVQIIPRNPAVARQRNMEVRGGTVTFVTPPVAYRTVAKDFTRTIPISTNTAFRTAVDPTSNQSSLAEAKAQARFSNAGGALTISPAGTFSEFTRNGALGASGPNGAAGTLIRDPLTWTDVTPGSTFSEIFSLSRSDFRLQNDDPNGIATATLQLGSDVFGTEPGSLGPDADGNPLLMELDAALLPSGDIFLTFEQDSSLGTQTFFDPENGDAPITGNIGLFIGQRLASALSFDPGTDTWTLTRDVSLFGDAFDVPSGTGTTTVDIDDISMAEVSDVPEPGTLPLAAASLLMLAGLGAWRRRETICSRTTLRHRRRS